MIKPEPDPEIEMNKILWDSKIQTDHLILARRPVLTNKKKKRTTQQKIDKYLDFTREMKKLWIMKVTVIPVVLGVLGAVSKEWRKNWWNLKSEEQTRPP